ncbi:MAG: cytidylate kinase-like family protein [Lachnospiraceae bacterium]|uniref:Cytidylate kinase-like family protein n=1 Tax=Candidatus Weimeria bifida TaxID=2599074 RepID=A0A6N7IZ19_9FIRM|nr:cytidylate kinase-like family protein [Candidatus Weimeria bifida]RRF94879.1 MAG: cytidylate kinase-like family protein [Lachnospiraceae bacterium]
MKHIVITIGCEYGAGGPQIGQMLAKALGIEYYDRDLVDSVVQRIGVDKDLVEKADQKKSVLYTFDTTLGPRYANLTNRVISAQFEVIHKFAEKSSCVIIGRSSDYILKDRNDVLNVFIYAPEEVRIKSVMSTQKVSRKKAEEIVSYNDEQNHARHKYITGTYRGDRKNRHILIDSSLLGWEKTAQYLLMLVEMLEEKGD